MYPTHCPVCASPLDRDERLTECLVCGEPITPPVPVAV